MIEISKNGSIISYTCIIKISIEIILNIKQVVEGCTNTLISIKYIKLNKYKESIRNNKNLDVTYVT